MSNLYDASPIYRQERIVRWLEQDKPPFVVVNRDHLLWDGFQKAVRVPIVFSAVASHYVPVEVVQTVHIFRRRGPAEAVAIGSWREALGPEVHVGRLASVSSFDIARGCTRTCGDLLEVVVPPGGSGKVSVPLTVSDLAFTISFTRVPDETTYTVLLDRAWFWDVAKRSGLPRGVGTSLPPDVRAQVRSVEVPAGLLY
jgi:hypothetical protein